MTTQSVNSFTNKYFPPYFYFCINWHNTAYTADSEKCNQVDWTHPVMASGKLVLQNSSFRDRMTTFAGVDLTITESLEHLYL